ncbi:S28 family serine protease [uncultured Draconibacterium sp.]|uniref:S28 family serine protease n=1 Tax=uncultured Draconibacterium sp. TaxID=1573823 RepID=UPI0025EF8A79|nr:S28 family serine protease [uncultured Draconibacterium sp.]
MQRFIVLLSLLLLSAMAISQNTLRVFLENQPEIKSIEQLACTSFFTEKYKVMLEQPLDHRHPDKGTFLQRVIIADKGPDRPVVFITEGYNGGYSESANYINELSPMLEANQICMDHRYFGESWPEPLNWDYLTVRNAAADHHHLIELMKNYYSGKWISTGISKGGQTAVYHRWLYPNDVEVTVPYVAPLNFGVEDGRHEPFIKTIPGTAAQRKKIENFQLEMLKNRAKLLPKLEALCRDKNYTFRVDLDEVFDLCVLEYPFALWQWGRLTDHVPEANAPIDQLFEHLMLVSGPSYFAIEGHEGYKSFFVQAARELGYYGYDTQPFQALLTIKTAKGYLPRLFLPKELQVKYQPKTAKAVGRFIQSTDAKILFIYGEWDPWSASAFEVPQKQNFLKVVKPGGSHSTRIANLPQVQKQLVKETLERWLATDIQVP